MTYGTEHGTAHYDVGDGRQADYIPGSLEFFQQIDRTLNSWNRPLHDESGPFGRIFNYAKYSDKPVLEVGCGMGSMAMYWSQRGARITAVDLSGTAVEQTTRRLALMNLPGTVRQEDSRSLSFANNSFDYAYSWGVLHHSPNLAASLRELLRVVKPGGGYGLMLYHRHSLYQWYRIQYVEGFLHGESHFLKPVALASRYSDGWEHEGNPHTWPVTRQEIRNILKPLSQSLSIRVLGSELDNLLPRLIPLPRFLAWMPRIGIKAWARRWGWSLWIEGEKKTEL
jgi:SAM-dependent methyltransferase